ncbi:MAG: HEPN domain-containing protein [Planctomycetota bacterium]
MPRSESTYPNDWCRIAEKDLWRAHHLLKEDDAEGAGFFLQQGIEKLLKAFLLQRGWTLKRVHDLEVLLNAALHYDESLDSYRFLCQRVTAFYMLDRYPLVGTPALEVSDVKAAMAAANPLLATLRNHIERSS